MKRTLFLTLLVVFLSLFESCGDSGNQENLSQRSRSHRGHCRTTTSGEDWKDFVENVKNAHFEKFTVGTNSCRQYEHSYKDPCTREGIFTFCAHINFTPLVPDSTPCSSGPLHEKELVDLVTPVPLNFEAEICGDTMVRAMIGVRGKGTELDLYQFNFEEPIHYNPTWQQVWKDKKKYKITVRQ